MKRVVLAWMAGVALFGCVTGLVLESRRASRAERTLEEIYQSALAETSEQMQALSLTMEKAMITGDAAQGARLMARISQLAEDVRRNLTFLPLSHEAMAPTLTFANQLAEYAATLLPVLVREGALPESDAAQLTALWTDCNQLGSQIALAQQSMQGKDAVFSTASGNFLASMAVQERPLEALGDRDNGMQYPTLIYDGAFSDARHLGTARGLPQQQVTQAEAMALARDFVGAERVTAVREAPATSGALPAWGITVETGDVQLNMEVTMQGGKVLWMMPETASFSESLSEEICQQRAEAFLRERGFAAMTLTYTGRYGDGLMVLNFAATQEKVLLYPDLVKVQVRMDTGEVVGLEANNYWMNHRTRTLPTPALSQAQARLRLAEGLTVTETRLCLIPQRDTERLCYEFAVNWGDGAYLIYVDAQTGEEAELLKRIDTAQGTLVA